MVTVSAEADFQRAAALCLAVPDEFEPDGEPNKAGVPTSTIRFNIFYHLALAKYLQGRFGDALADYAACMEYSRMNDDSLCATSDWLYMTLMRLGRKDEAAKVLEPIREDMDIIENYAYRRLLLYKGLRKPEELLSAGYTARRYGGDERLRHRELASLQRQARGSEGDVRAGRGHVVLAGLRIHRRGGGTEPAARLDPREGL